MTRSSVILCGGASAPGPNASGSIVRLDLRGSDHNVNLKISDISQVMASNIPNVLVDLLEVAAYVYAADQAVSRTGAEDTGKRWHRRFEFHVPVRCPDLWASDAVTSALLDTLTLLSEDEYEFHFTKFTQSVWVQGYFENFVTEFDADEVVLFSGGLDSLAGAIQEALVNQRRVALVSHRSAPKRSKKLDDLVEKLRKRCPKNNVLPVPVWANKSSALGRDYTQRSRSFLYAALASTVATMLGRSRIHFYENGVTSLNFPIAPQTVGARATRTTHPQVLERFGQFFSALLERPFQVENPFIWKTKTDVVHLIKEHGCSDLIPLTVSCSHTRPASNLLTHCGECSQCVDRRFATLAAGMGEHDPLEIYKVDLFAGERRAGGARTMIESYVRTATEVAKMSDVEFFSRFSEASRVVRHLGIPSNEAGTQILDLYQRHAKEVSRVLVEGLAAHASGLNDGTLPESCLAVLAVHQRYRASAAATPSSPTFRLETDFWRIWFENEAAPPLKNSKGFRHIAHLLSSPGREIHSIQLLALEAGVTDPPLPTSSGDVVDEKTIKDCLKALHDAREELEEAEKNKDLGRLQYFRQREEALNDYLASVAGQDGRPRRDGGDAERARKAVTNAINRARARLRKHHRLLWQHLEGALTTGISCSYNPHPPVDWTV